MRLFTAAVLFASASLLAIEARADEWYGYQTFTSDLVTGGATYLLATRKNVGTAPIIVGGAGYLVAPPVIHLVHAEPYRALASFGTRVATPILLYLAFDVGGHNSGLGEWAGLVGAAMGLLVASAVDAAAIAWESTDAPPATTTQPLKTISVGGSF